MGLKDSITSIKGVGEKTAELFAKLNIHTIEDLLLFYPRGYDLLPEIVTPSTEYAYADVAIYGKVIREGRPIHIKGLTIVNIEVLCDQIPVKIAYFNMPYVAKVYRLNQYYVFRGTLKENHGKFSMDHPKSFSLEEYEAQKKHYIPIYPVTKGLSGATVQKTIAKVLQYSELLPEFLPEEILKEMELAPIGEMVRNMHFPTDEASYLSGRKRLAFEEFLSFMISLQSMQKKYEYLKNTNPCIPVAECNRMIQSLPYELTGAQKRVWEEIKEDLDGKFVMNRLIQGDVGSGKTILAFLALVSCAANGYQGALMAPTEVLAMQHYKALTELLSKNKLPFRVALLTGSTSASDRKKLLPELEDGSISIVIGTHAIFQENVHFKKLALTVTDEQHRFGVRQREKLFEKGNACHVLVMSATPIPRSLAMILYSDMSLSVLDELPKGRTPIKNCVVTPAYRPTALKFILGEVAKGHQVYIICPMIENGEGTELENVTDYYQKLQANLPETVHADLLHGKMKNQEKNAIMSRFNEHQTDILVSTTVIEVGINVPNATVMMVENAERFGLATLHQLRGRVGRGDAQSYCIFVNGNPKKSDNERLNILTKSNDGFYIANEDLKLRGPGDVTGVMQSGDLPFVYGDIYRDNALAAKAKEIAIRILSDEEGLKEEKYTALLNRVKQTYVDYRSI